jgi:hypothetical protein
MGEKSLSAGGSPLTNIINYGEIEMVNFIIGIIVGFFIATYGISGVAQAVDGGLKTIKNINISVEK